MNPSMKRQLSVLRPSPLRPGDRIGVAAPASPFERDRFFEGIQILEKMGFSAVYDGSVFEADGYFAGSDAHRLAQLHTLFSDPAVRAVWCARGGYGSMRLLPEINYDLVRRNPKPFIGCSDISAMLNTICCRSGLVTFHGPMVTSLHRADELTMKAVMDALTGKNSMIISAGHPKILSPGNARGPVLGGNLATLCHLLGTPYMPDFSGAILFLEDTGEKPYRIDRMLTQMTLAGCFDQVAGIFFGTFENCGEPSQIERILSDAFSGRQIPILAGFDIGHGIPNITVPIGPEAILDTESGTLAYMHSAVA